jgi:hypothetical protein
LTEYRLIGFPAPGLRELVPPFNLTAKARKWILETGKWSELILARWARAIGPALRLHPQSGDHPSAQGNALGTPARNKNRSPERAKSSASYIGHSYFVILHFCFRGISAISRRSAQCHRRLQAHHAP